MILRVIFTTIVYFLMSICLPLMAQNDSTSLAQTEISILTCRSGDELYSTFGHTAIRIRNQRKDFDTVYNYGLFSFETPNFYVKFMRGQLPYLLGRTRMDSFLREYVRDKRSVFEQKLILDNDRKLEIIRFLEENAKPENREYAYDFFYDNCATRVVDVYDIYGKTGSNIEYSNPVEEKSFRDLLKENLKNLPWSDFGIDLVIGARADKRTTRRHQMFLPEYLMENLDNATVEYKGERTKLAQAPQLVLDFEEQNADRKSNATPWPLILMVVLFLITIGINIKTSAWTNRYNKLLLTLSGVLGLFLLFMWFGTNHGATRDNWNAMWLNPLLLLIFVKSIRSNTIYKLLVVGILLIAAINALITFLPQFFHFAFLPWIISIIVAFWMVCKDHRDDT